MSAYAFGTLADTLAQLVQFAWDDFGPDGVLPEGSQWTVAYQVACFTAQHTAQGGDGVETETGLTGLRVDERMAYPARLALARAHVAAFGGAKVQP